MKKLVALLLILVMTLSMTMVMAAPIPEDGKMVPTNANSSLGKNASYGSGYACIPKGSNINMKIDIPEEGVYTFKAKTINWELGAEAKLTVQNIPFGTVDLGNTTGAQTNVEVNLGSYELLKGLCELNLTALSKSGFWLYYISAERVGDLTGESLIVHVNNSENTANMGQWTGSHVNAKTAGKFFFFDVPSDGTYKAYYASANHVSGTKVHIDVSQDPAYTGARFMSNLMLPSHDEWGSIDAVYVGDLDFKAGYNRIAVSLASGTSMRPRGFYLVKKNVVSSEYIGGGNQYNDIDKNGMLRFNVSVPETAKYIITADICTNEASVQQAMVFHVEGDSYIHDVPSVDIQSPAWTTWKNNVLGVAELPAGEYTLYLKSLTGVMRGNNLRLTKYEPIKDLRFYLGDVLPTYEISTLRSGEVIIYAVMEDAAADGTMVAVLEEAGKIVDIAVGERYEADIMALLDTSKAENLAAAAIKVYMLESTGTLKPIQAAVVR